MIDYSYTYKYRSHEVNEKNGLGINLSTCSELQQEFLGTYFYGTILNPLITAKFLITLSSIVNSNYSINTTRLRDPVISIGNGQINFEAFSSCNGIYTKLELDSKCLDGEFLESGCVNVDFGEEAFRLFKQIGAKDRFILGVGTKDVTLIAKKNKVKERKVPLPNRWIRGFANVQQYLKDMEYVGTLSSAQSMMLFRNLPQQDPKMDYTLRTDNTFAFSIARPSSKVKIGSIHRLQLLTHLLPRVNEVAFYRNMDNQAFGVVLRKDGIKMTVLFSRNSYRGFSGDGQQYAGLSLETPSDLLVAVDRMSKTNETFNPKNLAIENNSELQKLTSIQPFLSSMGLLGYSLEEQAYYYRKLPFKLDRFRNLNSRLNGAEKLLDKNHVQLVSRDNGKLIAKVMAPDNSEYTVAIDHKSERCTCYWYTRNQGKRGFCKHILATLMYNKNNNQ